MFHDVFLTTFVCCKARAIFRGVLLAVFAIAIYLWTVHAVVVSHANAMFSVPSLSPQFSGLSRLRIMLLAHTMLQQCSPSKTVAGLCSRVVCVSQWCVCGGSVASPQAWLMVISGCQFCSRFFSDSSLIVHSFVETVIVPCLREVYVRCSYNLHNGTSF